MGFILLLLKQGLGEFFGAFCNSLFSFIQDYLREQELKAAEQRARTAEAELKSKNNIDTINAASANAVKTDTYVPIFTDAERMAALNKRLGL